MKRIGILSLGCAAALTVACAGEPDDTLTRDRDTLDRDASAVGTSGQIDTRAAGAQATSAQQFVNDMLAGGSVEIQLGKLAAERGSSPQVRQFGQRMVDDHSKAAEQLKQIASKHNVTTSETMTTEHRAVIDRLSSLEGEQFDRAYMSEMVQKHRDTVNTLEARAQDRNRQTSARPQGSIATTGQQGEEAAAGQPRAGADEDRPAATAGQGGQALESAVAQWASQTLPTVEGHLKQAQQIQQTLGGGANESSTTERDRTNR